MDTSGDVPVSKGKRCRAEGRHLASVVHGEVAKAHVHWWVREMKAHLQASYAALLEGVDPAISSWAAAHCDTASGQELSAERGEMYEAFVNAATKRELAAWKKIEVCEPVSARTPSKVTVDT